MITYVINLDRRPDKWAWVRERIAEQGIKVIRFTAVDTKPGWIGCRESHLDIMVKCYGEKQFMILEDDVEFYWSDTMLMVNKSMAELPEDWDCLYLGASPKEPQVRYSDRLFKLNNAHVAHAIIWNNRHGGAVEHILNHRQEINKIDDYFATVIQPKFNCFVTWPMLVNQRQFSSDTCKRSDVSTIVRNYNLFCK